MLLLILKILKKFNYNINIRNVKNFIKALAFEINEKEQNELKQVNKIFEEINQKIKENNENKINVNEFER